MCLPVWREWKHEVGCGCGFFRFGSTCAFPFGGNGNKSILKGFFCLLEESLHVPSRLEGIETGGVHTAGCGGETLSRLHVPSRLEGMETPGIILSRWQ